METLFKDLGILKFNNSNDPSLKQGLEFDRYQKDYLDASRYELLERSTTSSLSSVIESMSASNSNNNTATQSTEGIKSITALDTQFQQLLSEYTTTLKLLNQEVVTIRGRVTGEYVINLHYYESKTNLPVKASVEVAKINPAVEIIYYGETVLKEKGVEETAVRFSIADDGSVNNVNRNKKSIIVL